MECLVDSISLEYGDAKITFFGIVDKGSSPVTSWHRHNYYELHFSFEKDFEYEFENKTINFAHGQALIIPPQVLHNTLKASQKSDTSCIALAFTVSKNNSDVKFFDQIIKALENNSMIPLNLRQINCMDVLSLRDIKLYNSFLGICKLKSAASNIVYHLFGNILKDVAFSDNSDEKLLVLIDTLVNNPEYNLSDIAKATSYSERQISRIIKQYYGLSLSELRHRMKENFICDAD